MKSFKKKQAPSTQRSPHIVRQKQSTFQYSSNRAPLERTERVSPTDKEKPNFNLTFGQFRHRLNVVAGTTFAVFLVWFLSTLTAPPHMIITNNQQPIRNADIYDQAAKDAASNGIFSSSKFAVNRQKVAEQLQRQFPELETVDVTTPLFRRSIVVTATVSQPAAVLATNDANYVLDSRGVALFDVRKQQGKTSVKTDSLLLINDQSGVPIEVGKPALTSNQIAFAKEVKRQADAKQMLINNMTLISGGGELAVKHDAFNFVVKYNLYEDARKSFGTFLATKEHIDKTNVVPAEYIDVRVPERAYVK